MSASMIYWGSDMSMTSTIWIDGSDPWKCRPIFRPDRLHSSHTRHALSYARGLMKSGWGKGGGEGGRGRHCIGEAIIRGFYFCGGEHIDWGHEIFGRVFDVLSPKIGELASHRDLFDYNDRRKSTLTEMLALLDEVGCRIFGTCNWLDADKYRQARIANIRLRQSTRHIYSNTKKLVKCIESMTTVTVEASKAVMTLEAAAKAFADMMNTFAKETIKTFVKETVVAEAVKAVDHIESAKALLAKIDKGTSDGIDDGYDGFIRDPGLIEVEELALSG